MLITLHNSFGDVNQTFKVTDVNLMLYALHYAKLLMVEENVAEYSFRT